MARLCRIGSHEAELDAHIRNLWEVFRTGTYCVPIRIVTGVNRAFVANRLYGYLITIPRTMTFDRAAIRITTGDAGTHIRVGIYNVGTNLYPGTLLVDIGLIDSGSIATEAITISPGQQLTKGLYFLAGVSDGTPTVTCLGGHFNPLGGNPTNFAVPHFDHFHAAHTYGALPDPFPALDTLISGGWPGVRLRLESLD